MAGREWVTAASDQQCLDALSCDDSTSFQSTNLKSLVAPGLLIDMISRCLHIYIYTYHTSVFACISNGVYIVSVY